MTERDLVPASDIESSPLYTQVQKNALGRRALTYLQQHRLLINSTSLQGASSVIQDSLARGLVIFGEPTIKPSDGIKKYVDSGLRQREERSKLAATIAREASNRYQYSQFQGPFALDSSAIDFALYSKDTIPLLGDISLVDSLCDQAEERAPILEHLYDFALLGLPEELRTRARMRIQGFDEKARLSRNMMVSILATGNPNPIITMEDLARYITDFKQDQGVFSEQNLERMKVAMEIKGFLMGDKEESYIGGLFSQIADVFNGERGSLNDNVDVLFQRFGRTLLLLHPALEEIPITISKERISVDQPSLWDERNGVTLEGSRMPKREILLGALRQAEARGIPANINILRSAIRNWGIYDKEAQAHPGRVATVQSRIDAYDRQIASIRRRTGIVEPSPTIEPEYTALNQRLSKAIAVNNRNSAILEEEMDEMDEIQDCIREAIDSPDGQAFLPRSAYIAHLSRRVSSASASSSKANGESEKIRGIIEIATTSSLKRAIREDLGGILEDLMLKPYDYEGFLSRLYDVFIENTGANIFSSDADPSDVRSVIVSECALSNKIPENLKEIGLIGNDELLALLKNINKKGRTGKIDITDPAVLNAVSSSIALRLRNLVHSISLSITKRERSIQRRTQLEAQRRNLVRNPDIPLPPEAKRPLEWFEDRRRQLLIGSIPREVTPELEEDYRRFLKVGSSVFSYFLPPIIPPIDDLRNFLAQEITRREAELEIDVEEYEVTKAQGKQRNGTRETKRRVAERKIDNKRTIIANIHAVLPIMDDPSLHLDLAEGLRRSNYITLLGKKKNRIHRSFARHNLEERISRLRPEVRKAKREKDLKDALENRRKLQAEMTALKTINSPTQKLIKRMDSIGLVLDDHKQALQS